MSPGTLARNAYPPSPAGPLGRTCGELRGSERSPAAWPRLLLGLLWSGAVMGIGLGELSTDSRLNQQLDAEIPVLSVAPEELPDTRVSLALPEDFERAGIPRPHVLEELQFQIEPDGQEGAVIRVTSKRPIREPFLNFLVEVATPTVRLVREYTVLLDPVHYGGNHPESTFRAPSAGRSALDSRPRRDPFTVGTPAPTAVSPSAPPGRVSPSPPPAAASEKASPGQLYGPVQPGDSVSVLGFRLRPDEEVAGAQMAWALFLANRDAFVEGDIHDLRAGVMLRVPSREAALATPYSEAMRLVQFGVGVSEHTEAAPTSALRSPAAAPGTPEVEEPDTAPRKTKPENFGLRLLTRDEEQALSGSPERTREPLPEFDGATLPGVVQELRAQLQALTVENRRLSSRLAAAGQALRELQSHVEARDEELQRLQTQLAEAAARRTKVDLSQPGITIAPATVPVERDSPPEGPAAGSPDDGTTWISGAGQALAFLSVVGLLVWLMLRVQERARGRLEVFTRAGGSPTSVGRTASDESKQVHPRRGHALSPRPDRETERVAQSIAEAELCLAYGQFDVAESIMQQLVNSAPHAPEYRLKLLQVLHVAGKRELFLEQARTLRGLVEDGGSETWREAAQLGRKLLPEEPLFQGTPGHDRGHELENTVLSAAGSDGILRGRPGDQRQPDGATPIDTENLDFPICGDAATAATGSSETDMSGPLDLDIESTETGGRTAEQADRDLTDELLAWDQSEAGAEPDPDMHAPTQPDHEHRTSEQSGFLAGEGDDPETSAGVGSGAAPENGSPADSGHHGDQAQVLLGQDDTRAPSMARSLAKHKN